MAKAAQRFEDEYDPLHRVHVSPGRSSRHDWEGMLQALMIRLFEYGLPETQADFVAQGQDWFVVNAKDGSVPDESQIRRKLAAVDPTGAARGLIVAEPGVGYRVRAPGD